jgi:hypothetical protein
MEHGPIGGQAKDAQAKKQKDEACQFHKRMSLFILRRQPPGFQSSKYETPGAAAQYI